MASNYMYNQRAKETFLLLLDPLLQSARGPPQVLGRDEAGARPERFLKSAQLRGGKAREGGGAANEVGLALAIWPVVEAPRERTVSTSVRYAGRAGSVSHAQLTADGHGRHGIQRIMEESLGRGFLLSIPGGPQRRQLVIFLFDIHTEADRICRRYQ